MFKGEYLIFLVIYSQHPSECLRSFGIRSVYQSGHRGKEEHWDFADIAQDLLHLCTKKNRLLQTPLVMMKLNEKKDQARVLTWAFLHPAGFLASFCYLVDSRRIITTAHSGRICVISWLFKFISPCIQISSPMFVFVLPLTEAKISVVIPSAKDSYLALVS